jgi:proline iminopeptidase
VDVRLADGYRLSVEDVGGGFPLILLHGGPGADHTMFRPWLDALGDEFRLLYVDQRGQGRSDPAEPETLSIAGFAHDVDLLAEALGLEGFALLGHSFGAIVATAHAVGPGTASAYVISGGGDSSRGLMEDVEASLAALGDAGAPIAESWEREQSVETEQEFAELMEAQTPFHFAGPPPENVWAGMRYSPAVLRHFARVGYGDFDFTPDLGAVVQPTLVVVGGEDRTTTPRAARVLHEGIAGSELIVLEGAGHMSYIEATEQYLAGVRDFLRPRAA